MKKFKCKSCGKIYETKPDECSCGHDQFEEVTVDVKKEEFDLEKYAEMIKKETELEIKAKVKRELEEDLNKKSKENEESLRSKILKELSEKDKEKNMTDEQIKISNLMRMIEEQSETIEVLKKTTMESVEEAKNAKIKEEINKRVEKEPFLKKIVAKYLENGTIKTLSDYDNIITTDLRKLLKEKEEFEQKAKSYGADPMSEYSDNNINMSSSKGKDWKEVAKNKHQAEINKMFGIRK